MKKILSLTTLLFFALFLNSLIATNVSAADSVSDCTDPTVFLTIKASHATNLEYNKNRLEAPVSTCVSLTFSSIGIDEHDFQVDKFLGDGQSDLNLYLANSADGLDGDGVKSLNFTTPSTDKTYKFYCTIEGHEPFMKGNFVIGEGSSDDAPGFGIFLAFSSVLVLATIINRKRR